MAGGYYEGDIVQQTQPVAEGYAGTGNASYYEEPRVSCTRNTHRFACKHETRCACGMTARLPLDMDEGL